MAEQFEVEIEGLDELMRALKEYPNISEPILQKAVETSEHVLMKYTTKENVPWRTGMLCQTFGWEPKRLMARWFPTRKYGVYVNKRNPFMQRILDKSQDEINELFSEAINMISEKVAKKTKL